MNDKEQYKKVISFASSVMLFTVLTAFFGVVWYKFYSGAIVLPFYRKGNWLLIGIYMALTWLFYKIYGGNRVGYLTNSDAIYSQVISMVCVNVLTYFQISLIGRKFMPLYPVIMLMIGDLAIIVMWTVAYSKVYKALYPPRKMVIVYGGTKLAETLVSKMSRRTDKFMICKSVNVSKEAEKQDLLKTVLDYEGVIICDVPSHIRNDVLKVCFENSIRVYVSPKISDIIVRGATDIHLFDTPILLCRNYGLRFEQRVAKRIFDIVVSSIAFVVLSPIMLVTAVAIKICDGGSVFYKQKRLTVGGKEFYVYKFRSMVADAEKDGVARLAEANDDRVTPVGKVIRRFRIDEFPQLINILKGEMSLVGPRPERPELTDEYDKEMPEFKFRLKVKAGLTGYAQVMGKYDTTPYDKLKMDLMYIEKYSVLLDMKIILMTVKTMFFPNKDNSQEQ